MSIRNNRHQVLTNSTVTVSGNSGTITNLCRGTVPVIVAFLDVQGPVTGTTPSLTVTVYGWTGNNRPAQIAQFTAATAALASPQRLVLQNVLEENIQVSWAVSGTTPSFGKVSLDLVMSHYDA